MSKSITAEVRLGEAQEKRILQRWCAARALPESHRIIRSRQFQDFDYLILDERGFPYLYIEIKSRRIPIGQFGDAIFPQRKHIFAKDLLAAHNIELLAIVEYSDSLAEVDLTERPTRVAMLKRSDRDRPVEHAFYGRDQLRVLEGEEP